MISETHISEALKKFELLLRQQDARVEKMRSEPSFVDFNKLDKINIAVVYGDGIGPSITKAALTVMRQLLLEEEKSGKVTFDIIDDLTIENRVKENVAIPAAALERLKRADVILKGPTTTPQAGDGLPNIESANVAMRRELDLFANVRPVSVPALGIDWTFFRENTEGAYAVGSKGFSVGDSLKVDFTFTTAEGTERIIEAAFAFAKANGKKKVSAVTKANVIKTTDGAFLEQFRKTAEKYASCGISADEWYIDIATAKLLDENRRRDFSVFVLPNLYGDILTDEAAEIQGGVGTAGSANIGKKHAMFEAIHGSAPRMVKEGRDKYADPSSVMRAAGMLLAHIGFAEQARKLDLALEICASEGKFKVTGRPNGATTEQFAAYVSEVASKTNA